MVSWHIGCSGFHYKDWRGPFYPPDMPQRKWFEYYSACFKTLELNVTFYRFPRLPFLQAWYDSCPHDFRFSVKAPRAITHYKKFKDAGRFITSFYNTINGGLKEKLGPVLFQLPPMMKYNPEKLDAIINSVSQSFNNVIEFRHESWWRKDVYAKLGEHNITFCGMSHPELPNEAVVNCPVVYYRFHGVPDLYRSPYTTEHLKQAVNDIAQNQRAAEAWCFFNNDYNAVAAFNAKEMKALVETL